MRIQQFSSSFISSSDRRLDCEAFICLAIGYIILLPKVLKGELGFS